MAIIPDSFWEDDPIDIELVEAAAQRIDSGERGYEVAFDMKLQRSALPYWVR